jgi:MFS family permease
MRALRVISIAFLTAIAGAALSLVAWLYLTELYHVSNFEGGRGMLMFFALAPLGLMVGFISGLVVALRSRGTGFGGFAKAQVIALGIVIGLGAIVSGILFLAADHPPKLDGKSLALELELKIPPALELSAEPVSRRCTRVSTPTIATIVTRYLITARWPVAMATCLFRARLRCSQTSNRDLLVSIESEGGASQFIKLKLRAKPRKEDEVMVGLDDGHGTCRS